MRILYIDTSSSYLYTGIVCDGKLISEVQENLQLDLSKLALPKIAEMFSENNLKPNDIDKIIVVNGPGSFTGIRVGLTIAKVYAWSLNIPIIPITSLEAMACSCEEDRILVPIIDARRGYVYGAIYKDEEEILKPQHIKLETLMEHLKDNNYVFITKDDIALDGDKCSYKPNILKIVNKFCQKKALNPHGVNLEYLKLTEAEESRL